jgi:hypothetical protein
MRNMIALRLFAICIIVNAVFIINGLCQTPFTIGSTGGSMASGGPYGHNSSPITLTAAMFKSSGINTPLIPAAMANKVITAIGWNLSSPPASTVTGALRVWLKMNTANTLPLGTNFETEKAGATLFFMGTVTLPSTPGWWTITGNMGSTFAWDGTSANHLEVLTEFTRNKGITGSATGWEGSAVYGHSSSENALYCWTNTLTDYGQYNPVMNSGGSVRPNMQFMAGEGCVTLPPAPTAASPQTYCDAATVGSLTATGTYIRWYPTAAGGNGLAANTALTNDMHYYASQNINGCESADRADVKVTDLCAIKYTLQGTVTYDNSSAKALKNVTVYLKTNEGIKLDSALTDDNGIYVFENKVKNGTYKLDGKSTMSWGGGTPLDGLLINRFFISLYTFGDALKQKAANVNNDANINPVDALLVNRRFVAAIQSFTISDWQFENPVVTVANGNVSQNIKAVCAGDVDGSYIK